MVVSSREGVRWRMAGFLKRTRSLKGLSTDTPRAGLAMATFCLVPLTSFCQVTCEIFTGGLLLTNWQRSSTCEPTNPDLLLSICTIWPWTPGSRKINSHFTQHVDELERYLVSNQKQTEQQQQKINIFMKTNIYWLFKGFVASITELRIKCKFRFNSWIWFGFELKIKRKCIKLLEFCFIYVYV